MTCRVAGFRQASNHFLSDSCGMAVKKNHKLKHQSTVCDPASSGDSAPNAGQHPQERNRKEINDLKNE